VVVIAGVVTVFTLAIGAIICWLGFRTGRAQVVLAPAWWVPLFLKAAAVATVAVSILVFAAEYLEWRARDSEAERIVTSGAVLRTQRNSDHTAYYLDPETGLGASRLNRYDFRPVWELIALAGVIGGVVGGSLAVGVAHLTSRFGGGQFGFPVSGADARLPYRPE
jgi:hypothetical protein